MTGLLVTGHCTDTWYYTWWRNKMQMFRFGGPTVQFQMEVHLDGMIVFFSLRPRVYSPSPHISTLIFCVTDCAALCRQEEQERKSSLPMYVSSAASREHSNKTAESTGKGQNTHTHTHTHTIIWSCVTYFPAKIHLQKTHQLHFNRFYVV